MRASGKKEGFAEQRLVVVSRAALAAAARHPLLRALRATDAGYFPRAEGHQVERPSGAAEAILILCREGRGWVRLGDAARRPVGAGDAVLIAPWQPHAYGAEEGEPWTIQWSHFDGEEVAEWWRWHGLPAAGGVLRLRAGVAERLDLGRVHERLGQDLANLVEAGAALRWALASLEPARSVAEAGEPSWRSVETVEAWMREHRAGRVTLAGLARRAGLSVSHFAALFRARFGFSPVDYFLRLKIRHACRLLETTAWPVRRVAEEVGIEDALYFSRRFRRVMGVSPRAYRGEAAERAAGAPVKRRSSGGEPSPARSGVRAGRRR
jgi:AraC-like DNA-binding protein